MTRSTAGSGSRRPTTGAQLARAADGRHAAAVAGEFAFGASGTCLVTSGGRDAWFGTGGGAARVFHSRDGGATWSVTAAPIPAAEAGGVFSPAFRNPREGVMVGGDFTAPANGGDASGFTRDGGATWQPGGDLAGYRSGVDWLSGARATLTRSARQGPTSARTADGPGARSMPRPTTPSTASTAARAGRAAPRAPSPS